MGSCRGWVVPFWGGVGHVGVDGVGWGVLCRGGVGWVIQGWGGSCWGGVGCGGFAKKSYESCQL